jgi:hypothetical protein
MSAIKAPSATTNTTASTEQQVDPSKFTQAMTRYWMQRFKNVPNPAGQAGWQIMAETFNAVIEQNQRPRNVFTEDQPAEWHVIRALTGTGKTQGLAKYTSMLPADRARHPGVLIVTRLKIEATEMAKTINKLSRREDEAIAYHGDHKFPVAEMQKYPVLILTHRAYEIGLDKVNRGQAESSNWESYNQWQGTTRALVVVDEALDVIKFSQVTLETVKQVLGAIPEELAMKYPNQIDAIRTMENVLRQMAHVAEARKLEFKEHERVLWKGEVRLPGECSMVELRRELKDISHERGPLGVFDPQHKRSRLSKLREALEAIEATMDSWNWYSKKLREHTINAARLIVPDTIHSAVVLDGTANQNLIYKLFDRAKVISLPESREYPSATLHYSLGHSVGKREMKKKAHLLCKQLIGNLQRTLGPLPDGTPASKRRVFVATHKAIKPILLKHQSTCGFGELAVESFGRIRGRNHWRAFDTVVMFGLPFTGKEWAPDVFFAMCGIQTTQWLTDEKARACHGYKDIRQALDWGRMVAEVVQTLNRGRSRQPSTSTGDCEPVDLFILLPVGGLNRAILDGVKAEMPRVVIKEWEYADQKEAKRGAKAVYEAAIVAYCDGLEPGKHTAREAQKYLAISNRQWERLVGAMKNPKSTMNTALAAAGVAYVVERVGKTQVAYITKADA